MGILSKLNYWSNPSASLLKWVTGGRDPVQELSASESLYRRMADSCPDCGRGPEYMTGPQGGCCVNVFCTWCGQGYNLTPIAEIAEKIHRDQKYVTHGKKS